MTVAWASRLRYGTRTRAVLLVLFGLLVLNTLPLLSLGAYGVQNIHVHQALALLQGHVHLLFTDPGLNFDIALVDGVYQCPFPPFPSLLLVPFVALFGESVRMIPIALALTGLNVVVFTRLLRKLEIEERFIPWLGAAFFLGTPYWGVVRGATIGSYWAHVVAVTGILLALNEAFGRSRGFLIGLFIGISFLSRQLSIYTAIFLCAVLWLNPRFTSYKQRFGNLLLYGCSFGMAAGVYLLFNWLRFGDPFDTGYSKWILTDPFMVARWNNYGSFHPWYFFHNFVYMFIQGFHLEFSPPMYLDKPHVDYFGTSLTFASPFLFIAFQARGKKYLLWAAWTCITLCLLHALFYFGNGWVQENGIRYALDFIPMLMVLVALGIQRVESKIWKAAIVYSISLNLLAFSLISFAYDAFIRLGTWGKAFGGYLLH